MLFFTKRPEDCTGCTACMAICPVNAIKMERNDEGFLYPIANSNCIRCGMCEKVCHIKNKNTAENNFNHFAAAVITKKHETWLKSASGGAFTEICNAIGDENTIIFGATFENLKVIHKYVIGVKNIGIFRKSKYVESDLKNTFKETKEFLDRGKFVIWSGTPCQISGLKNYLSKDYNNLFCIDLICHGVGSHRVFDECIEYTQLRFNDIVTKYTFRAKRPGNRFVTDYTSLYEFKNRKPIYLRIDEYNQLFLSQLCLRSSCSENCRYRCETRLGDITIADFKRKDIVIPKLRYDYKNYSSVIVNTQKGKEAFDGLNNSCKIFHCSIDDVKKYNPLFYKTTPGNAKRDEFFKDFVKSPKEALKTHTKPVYEDGFLKRIKDISPYCIRVFSKTLRKGAKKSE